MKIVFDTRRVAVEVTSDITNDQRQRQRVFLEKIHEIEEEVQQWCKTEEDIGQFEKGLYDLLMETGLRATEMYLSRKRAIPGRKMLDVEGRTYKYVKEKRYELRSIFGQGTYISSQYRRGEKAKPRRELVAVESKVGLIPAGGMSPNLAMELVNLTTRMPYEQAKEVMAHFRPYVPSQRAVCGLIDIVGQHAEGVLDELPCEAGQVAVIQVDGRGMPKIRQEEYEKRCKPHKKRPRGQRKRGKRRRFKVGKKKARPRRTKGQKAKKKKQVTVGVIYTLDRQPDGSWEGPFGKYVARFGSAEEVFKRLEQTLKEMGSKVKRVLFISDGAPHYERLARQYFPTATIAVDFYHVTTYLWQAGETIYKEGSAKLTAFVQRLKGMLRNGEVEKVLRVLRAKLGEIPKRGPGTKGRRKRMTAAIQYLSKRVDLMPYKELRDEGLEIGSGVIESAMRQVVAIRFDGPGMRWGDGRAQLLLHLLCVRLSGGWQSLRKKTHDWAHQPHHRRRMTPPGVNEGKSKTKQVPVAAVADVDERISTMDKAS